MARLTSNNWNHSWRHEGGLWNKTYVPDKPINAPPTKWVGPGQSWNMTSIFVCEIWVWNEMMLYVYLKPIAAPLKSHSVHVLNQCCPRCSVFCHLLLTTFPHSSAFWNPSRMSWRCESCQINPSPTFHGLSHSTQYVFPSLHLFILKHF